MNRHQRRAAKLDSASTPGAAEDPFLHAVGLHRAGKLGDAIKAYGRISSAHPHYAEAQCYRGAALYDQGKSESALEAYDRALSARPSYADAHYNAGLALAALQRWDAAVDRYLQALALDPDHVKAMSNLANVLRILGDAAASAEWCRQALARQPNFANAHANLGNALLDLGHPREAAQSYRSATALDPSLTEAHWGEAFALLADGDFQAGWRKHEWRWRKADMPPHPHRQSLWSGQDIAGQRILLHCEQGLGDALQFIRYAQLVKERGAEVVVLAPPRLAWLLGTAPGIDRVVTQFRDIPPCQWQCPLMSLPLALGTIPATVPYLHAAAEKVELWRKRLGTDGFKVGIVWQGNPAAAMDKGRSVPLQAFAPLGGVPGLRLISLQREHGLDQLRTAPDGLRIETLGPDFDAGADAFTDAAAVMMSMDLVISSDTSVAHLAGALGRPVWVALQTNPDWRWMLNREDSPWYPTMRLFRQRNAGNWSDPFQRMADRLRETGSGMP